MGIYKAKDRRGRRRYVVSKYWAEQIRSANARPQLPERTGASNIGVEARNSSIESTDFQYSRMESRLERGIQ